MAGTLVIQNLQGPSSGTNANKVIVPSGHTLDASSGFTPPTGHVVAVYKAFSNTMQTITSTSLTNITDLSITMTPKDANNLLVMQSVVTANYGYVHSLTILKDGSKTVTTTQTNNNEADTHITYYNGSSASYMGAHPIIHYETAGSTSSRTYTVAGTSGWAGGSYSMIVNNRSGSDMGSTSWFLIMEIAQ